MSYLVLARRWRPNRFSELVGQPHVAKTLLNGLRQERIAHAYLFSGPRGVGKTTTARLFAKAINCTDSQAGEPCGKCGSCVAIAEGRFIDVIEIDAASNTGVDDIRTLRDGIRYAPIEGKAKVYVIDEVHMLSPGAFNALLKTLEEPPAHGYFCLATTESQKIPATIISRCQRFDFRRVSTSEIRGHLQHICNSDQIKFDLEALDLIARRADGSVRDSLSLLDQVLAYSGGSVLKLDAIDVAGEIRLDLHFRALNLVRDRSTAEAFRLDAALASTGTDAQDYILGLERFLIQLIQVKSLGLDNIDLPQEFSEDFDLTSELFSEADLVRLLNLTTEAEADVRRNYNPRVRLQLLLLRFATFERSLILTDLIEQLAGTQPPAAKSSATAKRPAKAQPKAPSDPAPSPQPGPQASVNHSTQLATTPQPVPTTEQPSEQPEPTNQGSNQTNPPPNPVLSAAESSPEAAPADTLVRIQNAWEAICSELSKEYNSSAYMIQLCGYPVGFSNGRLKINFNNNAVLHKARTCLKSLQNEIVKYSGQVILDLQMGDLPNQENASDSEKIDEKERAVIDKFNARLIN